MKSIIKGLGNDIIEIDRIKKAVEDKGQFFLDRIFTKEEQEYCNKNFAHLAGRFAAKEAIAKALGAGIGEKIGWLDLEISNNDSGKPQVKISEKVKKNFHNPTILISISHCRHYATAMAIWISDQSEKGMV